MSAHGGPVDIKVGNHPRGLSPCGKPIDCAHSAVLQSGDLLSFVERLVHAMQTEICLILQSFFPLVVSGGVKAVKDVHSEHVDESQSAFFCLLTHYAS